MNLFSPTTSIVSSHLHGQRVQDEFARISQFKRAWEAYRKADPPPIPAEAGRPNDNVRVNLVKLIVKTSVGFLLGDNVQFKLEQGGEGATDDPEEEWLKAVWKANKKMTWLYKQGINGALCGHYFARIYPGTPYPRLVILDPATVTVRWAADDIDLVEAYIIDFCAYEWVKNRERLVYIRQDIRRNEAGKWEIRDQRSTQPTSGFELVGTPEIWPYDWPPIIDSQNMPAPNEFWGDPDITDDLIDLVNSGDSVLSHTRRIVRFHSQPITVFKGIREKDIKYGRDKAIIIENPAGDVHTVEMQSDQIAALSLHERIKGAVHEVSQTPEVATGKVEDIGQLSGLALGILYGPLSQKTREKRMLLSDFLVELNRRLLEMGGFANRDTAISWASVVPSDPKAEREVAKLDQELGVSKETTLTDLGRDAAEEARKREKEKPAAPPMPPAMMPGVTPPATNPADPKGDTTDDTPVLS